MDCIACVGFLACVKSEKFIWRRPPTQTVDSIMVFEICGNLE